MTDAPDGDREVTDDDAAPDAPEDRTFDTLDDAVAALADDEDEAPPTEDAPVPDEGDAEDEPADDDDEAVTFADGTSLSRKELDQLRADGLRQADYTRKTQALASEREAVQRDRTSVQGQIETAQTLMANAVRLAQSILPPEPSMQLLQTNPGEFIRQREVRNRVIEELSQIDGARTKVEGFREELSQADRARLSEAEDAKLVKALPHLADPLKRAAFDQTMRDTALSLGFTEAEAAQLPIDHRLKMLVHYAALGKRAEANREANRKAAERRVETPKPGKARPAQATAAEIEHRKALSRLKQSGSIADALKLNF